jgi:peptidoglycan/xylan/chitin deacetylase (PgdA/CDA1 family)
MVVDATREANSIVPLRELLARHRTGRPTRGLVAITFDDAYAALLSPDVAFLRNENIPFTIFVTTDASRTGSDFWWDRVDTLFSRTSRQRWRAFELACGLPSSYRDRQPVEFGPLRPLRQWMLHAYRGRMPEHVGKALSELEEESGFRTAQRAMTFTELHELTRHPAVDIGVHTVSHPVLPLLSDDEQAFEISRCHSLLREQFPNVVPVLAAPFGLFDQRSLDNARYAGMTATLTLGARTLHGAPHVDALPRFCMCAGEKDWKLVLRLAGFLEPWRRWRDGARPAYPELPSEST